MGFTYRGVRQDFRWIEPGTFWMGSPENEPERESLGTDETLHQVKISRGFWLADTTVTQALWQAVMGENPSQFKGENRPVEKVSWNDATTFIDRMNRMKPELKLCLPPKPNGNMAAGPGQQPPFPLAVGSARRWSTMMATIPMPVGKRGNTVNRP